MKAVQIVHFGGPEAFRLVEMPPVPLTPGSVRIQVNAAGVNFADVMMRMGLYPEAPPRPFVPGYELAGTVTEAGSGVVGLKPGDRVLAACRFGGYTEEIVLPESQVRKIPPDMSDLEAAAVPVAFMTAWIALEEMARVREGDRVLIPGAAGGVGTAAVQIAARDGAYVVGLVGSERKLSTVRELGGREAFTYAEWKRRPESESAEFDVIIEARGGADLKESIRRLSAGGRIVSYGVSSMISGLRRSIIHAAGALLRTPIVTPIGLAMKNTGVFGLNMLTLFDTPHGMELLMKAMDGALEGFHRKSFRVIVGKIFPLSEAGAAHAYLQSGENIGKVVLRRESAAAAPLRGLRCVLAPTRRAAERHRRRIGRLLFPMRRRQQTSDRNAGDRPMPAECRKIRWQR
jgi:NADPH:quinone reductase-like Zn-dependent oxidoreductase